MDMLHQTFTEIGNRLPWLTILQVIGPVYEILSQAFSHASFRKHLLNREGSEGSRHVVLYDSLQPEHQATLLAGLLALNRNL